jgi:hypothetical protein
LLRKWLDAYINKRMVNHLQKYNLRNHYNMCSRFRGGKTMRIGYTGVDGLCE